MSKVVVIPGFAAKQVEEKKFKADKDPLHPMSVVHGGRHKLISFAMKDGGRIGARSQAALRMLAEHVVAKEKLPPMSARAAPLLLLEAVAMWTRRWHQKLFGWLHLTLPRQVLRCLAPFAADGASYS
jgi:hypothetical protein